MKRLEKRIADLEQAKAAEDVVLQIIYFDELTGEEIEGERFALKAKSEINQKKNESTNQD